MPLLFFLGMAGVAVIMWTKYVQPPTLIGRVEQNSVLVNAPETGTVVSLNASRFQRVKKGELLARLRPVSPNVVQSRLELIKAEIDLLKAELKADTQRNDFDHAQLRLDWMQQKVDLATARANLHQASNEVQRLTSLHRDDVVSTSELEQAEARAKALEGQVNEREALVQDVEEELQGLRAQGSNANGLASVPEPTKVAIEVQAKRLQRVQAELGPKELTAPMNGMVSEVFIQSGANVVGGDPIVRIRSSEASRIIGYLKQPLPADPPHQMKGRRVKVRARSEGRNQAFGQILEVGNQMHTVTNRQLLRANQPQSALPIVVSVPPQLSLRPGELVDLIMQN